MYDRMEKWKAKQKKAEPYFAHFDISILLEVKRSLI